jgi:hypothetical protein
MWTGKRPARRLRFPRSKRGASRSAGTCCASPILLTTTDSEDTESFTQESVPLCDKHHSPKEDEKNTTTEDSEDAELHFNEISGAVVDSSMKVHPALGPGLLENVYIACVGPRTEPPGIPNGSLSSAAGELWRRSSGSWLSSGCAGGRRCGGRGQVGRRDYARTSGSASYLSQAETASMSDA